MKQHRFWSSKASARMPKWALTFIETTFSNSCLSCRCAIKTTYPGAVEHGQQSSAKILCIYCNQLHQQSILNQSSSCLRCALPFDYRTNKDSPSSLICAECQIQAPAFSRCVASCVYEGVPAQLVRRCKHQAKTAAIEKMADQIEATLSSRFSGSSLNELVDCLVPVPLHPARKRKRGFNQAALLAHSLGEKLQIDVIENACQRVINNRDQQTLNRKARKNNLKKAFSATPRYIAGKRIAIIDDVVTTGATADELARELLRNGAMDCQVWCYARTAKPD